MVIFIRSFASRCECYATEGDCTGDRLYKYIAKTKGYPKGDIKIIHNGHYIGTQEIVENNSTIEVVLSLCGGKGGFGSMLRAIGAQIEKTTNREACRDLSGRRLRDINEEQRLKRWISKKAEREKEAAERRRRKLEQMCSLPKHDFKDPKYDRERRDLSEKIDDSVIYGLKAATTSKRKAEDDLPSSKKKCLWLGVNVDDENSAEEASCSDDDSSIPHAHTVEGNISMDEVTDESQDVTNDDNSISRVSNSDLSNSQKDESESPSENENREGSDVTSDANVKLVQSQKTEANIMDTEPLDLMSFQSSQELEQLGLDRLKAALQYLGMKCGGTLQQRAERLWLVRGLDPSDISPNLLAKPSKSKK